MSWHLPEWAGTSPNLRKATLPNGETINTTAPEGSDYLEAAIKQTEIGIVNDPIFGPEPGWIHPNDTSAQFGGDLGFGLTLARFSNSAFGSKGRIAATEAIDATLAKLGPLGEEVAAARTAAGEGRGATGPNGAPELPSQLTSGRNAESGVTPYAGIRNGDDIYSGITNDIARRQAEHGARFDITALGPSVIRGAARAIEQARIVRNQGVNIRNSISPTHAWYQNAVDWGEAWLRNNGY